MITGVGREAMTTSMKLQAFKYMEKKEGFFASPRFTVLCQMGKKKKRNGLSYSPSTGKAFCFQCKLFSPEDSAFFKSGF